MLKDPLLKHQILETIIDSAYEWIVVVDHEGYVQYMNKTYCEFLGEDPTKVIGKHVTDVIENTRMDKAVLQGKVEIADLQFIRGNYMIANRIPILFEGKVIGAVGTVIFRDTEQWKKMNSHIKALLHELNFYKKEWDVVNGATYTLNDFAGNSEEVKRIKERVKNIASGDLSVLIRGESGTGKELLAHSIHQLSERSAKPFIKINCGAVPEHLFESELFGYSEGAFTGAKKGGKPGKFQLADGGTLFLDEIGDLPQNMQIKLLRVLQEKEIEPVGAIYSKKINVRVIAATNRPLEQLIKENKFREDLFYRINVLQIHVPPIRERKEDIWPLTERFIESICAETGKRIIKVDQDVKEAFLTYDWPGNVRELKNFVEAALQLTLSDQITLNAFPDFLSEKLQMDDSAKTLKEYVQETERKVILNHLKKMNGDVMAVADELGIGKTNLYEKIKKYKIKDCF
ncbi:sigma-54 interaction domain-containing protein [Fictibacillus barbaricus]|uniref:Transcriptional regulator with PAS, ATPase and Fis domain n=1 Tax=Fictibacillus barbaricus TaxID=182136 RepID=A0ABU1U038_9BACL|nr:sigma 54-interacting transcriptional regulator [Fictibacillus barbaricus]MDR7072822.1 transcriptional regulator with PAS, ATPase and Fis domain [Fictibacillus barbaricus]